MNVKDNVQIISKWENSFISSIMLSISFIVLSVITSDGVTALSHAIEEVLRKEVSSWCRVYPFGRIYAKDSLHVCSHNFEDSEELRIRTCSLTNITLKVGVIFDKDDYGYDCFGYYDVNGPKLKDSYSKYILNLLREILHFKVRLIPSDTWGTFNQVSNNWSGLVGLAQRKLIDIGLCHPTITEEREEEVDFLLSTLSSTRSFVFDPSKLPVTQDVFVLTFSPTLWFSFFTSIALLIVCFRFSTSQHSRVRPDHEPWSWIEVVLWANAAICQQSYSRHPKGSSCRTMFLIGYLITYLLYTGFAAGVTSLLAVQGQDLNIGYQDVLTKKLRMILQSEGTNAEFLKSSADADARSLYLSLNYHLPKNKVGTLHQLFSRLETENSIGLGSTVSLLNYIRRKLPVSRSSDFILSSIPHSRHQKAFLLPKGSQFKEIFNYWLLRLAEAGLVDFGKKKYVSVSVTGKSHQNKWSSAGLGNVSSAIFIFCGGWFFSVLILFLEIIWNSKAIHQRTVKVLLLN